MGHKTSKKNLMRMVFPVQFAEKRVLNTVYCLLKAENLKFAELQHEITLRIDYGRNMIVLMIDGTPG
jgi:hypothetical protein